MDQQIEPLVVSEPIVIAIQTLTFLHSGIQSGKRLSELEDQVVRQAIEELTTVCIRVPIELEIRTRMYPSPDIPEAFCVTKEAYKSGYEYGWRGRPYNNTYTRKDSYLAFTSGYQAGKEQSRELIETSIAKRLNKAHGTAKTTADK
jgi:hypothetical protein